jgi:cobalamin biosynthesis Mg chelatase CobN
MFARRPLGINGKDDNGLICPYGLGKNASSNGGDPSRNVLDLVNAAIERVDDLRESETRHQTEVARLLVDRVEAMMKAESNRIDAIRAVDVDAVRKDSMASAVQAQTLAAQVSQTAEAMRTQVAATASAAASALMQATEAMRTQVAATASAAASALDPIIKDVAELRRAQYEAQGQKTQIVETQAKGGSTSNWMGLAVAALVGFLSIIIAVAAVVISVAVHKP